MRLFSVVSFGTFAISPIIWCCLFISDVLNRRWSACFFAAAFLGIVGYALFPWGDGYERYKVFVSADYFKFFEFLSLGLLQGDILFYAIAYIVRATGLDYQVVQFLFVFLGYFYVFRVLSGVIPPVSVKSRAFFFLFGVLSVSFIGLANNLRFGLSVIFLIYAIFLFRNGGGGIPTVFYIFLSGLTHFSGFFLFFLYFLSACAPRTTSRRFYVVLLAFASIVAFLSPFLFQAVARVVVQSDGFISRKVASYLLGGDGVVFSMVSSPQQFIHYFFREAPFFVLVFYLTFKGSLTSVYTQRFLLLSYFAISVIYFFSVYLRISYFVLMFGVMVFSWGFDGSRRGPLWLRIMLVLVVARFVVSIVYFERLVRTDGISILNDNSLCVLVSPPFFITDCSFSDQQIRDGNTLFVKLKEKSRARTQSVIDK